MKKKLVRMFLTIAVAAITLVGATACAVPGAETGGKAENESTEESSLENVSESDSLAEEGREMTPQSVTVDESTGITVEFYREYTGNYESATIIAKDIEGKEIWSYDSGSYEIFPPDMVAEIGINQGKYYFVENGTITVLNIEDGSIAWKNDEYSYFEYYKQFDEEGNLYLTVSSGPDLMIIDADGNTIVKEVALDENVHWWSKSLNVADGYVFVGFQRYLAWDEPVVSEEWKEYSDTYTLSYCIADGTVDFEHNFMETEPSFNGKYTSTQEETLEIYYLNDNKYLMSFALSDAASVKMDGVLGQLEDGKIVFSASYENGFTYEGVISQEEKGLVLTIEKSNDASLTEGTTKTFAGRETMTVAGK